DAFRAKAPQAANHSSIHFLMGYARSFTYPDGEFPFVIHAATEQGHAPGTFDLDLQATKHVLEFARTHATKRLLLRVPAQSTADNRQIGLTFRKNIPAHRPRSISILPMATPS